MSGTVTPGLFLVDDEVICLKVGSEHEEFRLRIWKGQGVPAVALVSQIPGNVPPSKATEKLANCVKRVWLAHGPMFYFERNGKLLQSLSFVSVGLAERTTLTRPKHRTIRPDFIAGLVNHDVD